MRKRSSNYSKMAQIGLFAIILAMIATDVQAETSPRCPEEDGYYFTNNRKTNPKRGGFVANGAYVSEGAFIAPTAAVCNSASVEFGARIMGNAIIKDEAMIEGNVRVIGNAIVGGSAMISGSRSSPTIIKGYARIFEGRITGGHHGSTELPEDILKAREEAKRKEIEDERRRREFRNFRETADTIAATIENSMPYRQRRSSRQDGYKQKGSFEITDDCRINAYFETETDPNQVEVEKIRQEINNQSIKGTHLYINHTENGSFELRSGGNSKFVLRTSSDGDDVSKEWRTKFSIYKPFFFRKPVISFKEAAEIYDSFDTIAYYCGTKVSASKSIREYWR